MTLLEFINHLKHKSLYLFIYVNGHLQYWETLGNYIHYKHRGKYDNLKIDNIETTSDGFTIDLKEEQ